MRRARRAIAKRSVKIAYIRLVHAQLERDIVALRAARLSLPSPAVSIGTYRTPAGNVVPETRLLAPNDLSLGNFESTMAFIEELRWSAFVKIQFRGKQALAATKRRYVADLTPVETLTIDAALVVAAEFDRIRRVREFKPKIEDVLWAPWLRVCLRALGFYEIVDGSGESTAADQDDNETAHLRFVRLASGDKLDPQAADDLLTRLQTAAGDAPERQELYASLIEAIGNAQEHAYRDCPPYGLVPRIGMWWAGGAYDLAENRLHLSVYDQGKGIPATLPSNEWFKPLLERLGLSTDADQIEAALEYGRTSAANPAGRGNGLWRMVKLAESRPKSYVHIFSGRGHVSCNSDGQLTKRQLPVPFCGTLIHWNIFTGEAA
ncbi:MAG: Uncharacterized protein FD124_1155 [Alphaproteobacteria bacterium]|nr:MAG: Uncharacterized protein FD124_1155 [Alphaproteobacteria bacterium]